ncbi:PTS glucose transporter subunit IIA [Kocuria sp. JC486]|uniref:PTS glucose transporter subunit IIA n=1 Tax=Kocuria soli TaxID=2485125 RepID=A0A3N4A6G3_9MICC|nr:PTS glucose transporter subunit IIA [Kocuria soli]NHU85554.1 PTS glucose transporter subunit IIA [Kocuria sp. JC486]ROZ64371.1 PTS glucose transporter subunit IIA [Kocuria soli]
MSTTVRTPFAGRAVPLTEVPDPVFAQGMVGPGAAVVPAQDAAKLTVVAPVAGTVMKAMPHAVAVVTEAGQGVLVHVGLDTVELKGEGFEVLVEKKQNVTAGQELLRVDAAAVRAKGYNLCSPVVVMDGKSDDVAEQAGGPVSDGATLFRILTEGTD